jgi:IclR family transcriptional regulator, acetate operon repressor
MQTVDKAVELLGYFSERRPEIGLSDLARAAGFDKASTRRLLLALIKHDYIEQNPITRAYRLGVGVLRLARVRESSTPLDGITRPLLEELVVGSGETAHFSILSGGMISSVGVVESPHSNRINFALGEEGPLHATSSGIVSLAFSNETVVDDILDRGLEAYTGETVTGKRAFRVLLKQVRQQGYCINSEMYEKGVCSIAAPVLDQTLKPIGAIAVAAPTSRFTPAAQSSILVAVKDAALRASRALGAELHGKTA